jgi:hypothetical protein
MPMKEAYVDLEIETENQMKKHRRKILSNEYELQVK